MLCHGQGDVAHDGCCYVNGQVCPNRWRIDRSIDPDGVVFDAAGVSLGTVDAVARSFVGNNPQRRATVAEAVQGTRYICSAAVLAIDADPSILNDRTMFEAAWEARPEYQVVADAWEANGQPRNWCMSFGPAEGQCCYAEDQATNDAKRAALSATAVSIRRRANGAT